MDVTEISVGVVFWCNLIEKRKLLVKTNSKLLVFSLLKIVILHWFAKHNQRSL